VQQKKQNEDLKIQLSNNIFKTEITQADLPIKTQVLVKSSENLSIS
jgi:hypothetical protein